MKITLFGATGMTGKYLISEAIGKLHEVRAFGRNVFEVLSTERKHLELFKGYLFSESDIKNALKGSDAVLSAIGGAMDGTDKARSLGMKNIVSVMKKYGPKRIVAIGGLGILDAGDGLLLYQKSEFPKIYVPVSQEHHQAWQLLAQSDLDWTLVCPPDILDAKATGRYNLERNQPAPGRQQINAGDLAEFMVRELKNNDFLHCRVGIATATEDDF